MRRPDYQQELKTNAERGLYPAQFAASCQRGRDRVRVAWKRLPPGAQFATSTRLSKEQYERRHAELLAKGYERASLYEYSDCQGQRWIQAVWMRSGAAREAKAKASAVEGDWMTAAEFRQEVERRKVDNVHPAEIRGACRAGEERFRAAWQPSPAGASVQSYVGMAEALFSGRDSSFRASGYERVWLGEYTDCSGVKRFQATWLKPPPR